MTVHSGLHAQMAQMAQRGCHCAMLILDWRLLCRRAGTTGRCRSPRWARTGGRCSGAASLTPPSSCQTASTARCPSRPPPRPRTVTVVRFLSAFMRRGAIGFVWCCCLWTWCGLKLWRKPDVLQAARLFGTVLCCVKLGVNVVSCRRSCAVQLVASWVAAAAAAAAAAASPTRLAAAAVAAAAAAAAAACRMNSAAAAVVAAAAVAAAAEWHELGSKCWRSATKQAIALPLLSRRHTGCRNA